MITKSRKNNLSRIAAYIALFSILFGLNVASRPAIAQADPIGQGECFPAVLMLRGSGETSLGETNYPKGSTTSTALIATNGAEGERLSRALEAFSNQAEPAETVSKLRFVGIEYAAAEVKQSGSIAYPDLSGVDVAKRKAITDAISVANAAELTSHYLGNYLPSIIEGAENVVKFIQSDVGRGCNTQYLLMGYSQGALSARIAINLMGNNTDKIMGSYLIGDPYQKGSGASSDRQISDANTGHDRDGMVRNALNMLTLFLASAPAIAGNAILSGSDSVAYRDDGVGGFASRALCHEQDQVCWSRFPWESHEEQQHLNYFLDEGISSPGYQDLAFEPQAFDQQLQMLANSQPANPRERTLREVPSVTGQSTSYNIANMRPDDVCSWDEGSDSHFETIEIPCGVYNGAVQTGNTAKMTVEVTDSFGIPHTYSTEQPVVDLKEIADSTTVAYDKWIRYESLAAPTECITMPHKFESRFYGAGGVWGNVDYDLRSSPCLSSPSQHVDYNATQVFKRVTGLTDAGEPTDHYLWGLDDRHRITSWWALPLDSSKARAYPTRATESDSGEEIKVELAQIRNGTRYYQFKLFVQDTEWCTSHNSTVEELHLKECDVTDDRQLFKAVYANEADQYGALSENRDDIPPTTVTGLEVTEIDYSVAHFSWDPSTDNRTDKINYYFLEAYNPSSGEWEYGKRIYDDETATWYYLDWPDPKFRVQACDYSDNCSSPSEIQVPWVPDP